MDPRQHLSQAGGKIALATTLLPGGLPDAARVHEEAQKGERNDHEREQGQAPAHQDHDGHEAQHDPSLGDEREEGADEQIAEHGNVAGQPRQ